MNNNVMSIIIKAQDQASRVLDGVKSRVSSLSSNLRDNLGKAALVGAAGIGALVFAGVGLIKQAAEEEKMIVRLKTAVEAQGLVYSDHVKKIEGVIEAGVKLAFSDDQTRESLAKLIPATGSYDEAVKRLAIAQDLARGTGLDLATASKLVGKINEENVSVLSRYGIAISNTATQEEALAIIQQKFSGQAAAYAETAAAKWETFGHRMDDIKEAIGSALLPVVTELGEALSNYLLAHQDDIDRFAKLFSVKLLGGIESVRRALTSPFAIHIFETLGEGFEALQPALQWIMDNEVAVTIAFAAVGAAMLLAFSPITGPVLAVSAAITGLIYVIGLWHRERGAQSEATLQNINKEQNGMERLLGKAVAVNDGMAAAFEKFDAVMKEGIITWSVAAWEAFDAIQKKGNDALELLGWGWIGFQTVVIPVIDMVKNNWNDLVWLIKGTAADIQVVTRGFVDDFWKVVDVLQVVVGWMADDTVKRYSGLINGIRDSVGWLTDRFWQLIDVITVAVDWMADDTIRMYAGAFDVVRESVGWLADRIWQLIDAIKSIPKMPDINVPGGGLLKKVAGLGRNATDRFAEGVRGYRGGLAIVGERGPELVHLPRGANVYSNSESRSMLNNKSDGRATQAAGVVQHIYIDRLEVSGDPRETLAALGVSL